MSEDEDSNSMGTDDTFDSSDYFAFAQPKPKDETSEQQESIQFVSTMLSVDWNTAKHLLIENNWEDASLVSQRINAENMAKKAGLIAQPTPVRRSTCGICSEDFPRAKMDAAACGRHFICSRCMKLEGSCSKSFDDGRPGCSMPRCPDPACSASFRKSEAEMVRSEAATDILSDPSLLSEILKSLPANVLLKCKRVSKLYYTEIESPSFALMRSSNVEQQFFVVHGSSKQGSCNDQSCYTGHHFVDFVVTDIAGHTFANVYPEERFEYSEILGAVDGVVCFVGPSRNKVRLLNLTSRELSPWIKQVPLPGDYDRFYLFGYSESTRCFTILCKTMVSSTDSIISTSWEVLQYPECTWRTFPELDNFYTDEEPEALYSGGCFYIFSEVHRDYYHLLNPMNPKRCKATNNSAASIFIIDLTKTSHPHQIHYIPSGVLGLISLSRIDYQKWLKLIKFKDSIAIVRRLASTELRFCYVINIRQSLEEDMNWSYVDIRLPVFRNPVYAHDELIVDFKFDILNGSSELLLETHTKQYGCEGHVTLHTIFFDQILKDSVQKMVSTCTWRELEIRGHEEAISENMYNSFRFNKMVFPFSENLRQLRYRHHKSNLGEITGSNSSIPPSDSLPRAMLPSTGSELDQISGMSDSPCGLDMRIAEGKKPSVSGQGSLNDVTLGNRSKFSGMVKWFASDKGYGFIVPDDGSADLFVHYTSIVSDGYRSLSENQLVEYEIALGDDERIQAVKVTSLGGSRSGGNYGHSRSDLGYHGGNRHGGGSYGSGGGGGSYGSGGGGGNGGGSGGHGHSWSGDGYGGSRNGGGGGGGGYCSGSGGGGAACYRCGESGHFARECYQPK